MKFVRYAGTASGYLMILTNKDRNNTSIPQADEQPVGSLYLMAGMVIAISDIDFELLKRQGHVGKGKLEEVPAPAEPKHGTISLT
jgi:hypothetical protein